MIIIILKNHVGELLWCIMTIQPEIRFSRRKTHMFRWVIKEVCVQSKL